MIHKKSLIRLSLPNIKKKNNKKTNKQLSPIKAFLIGGWIGTPKEKMASLVFKGPSGSDLRQTP